MRRSLCTILAVLSLFCVAALPGPRDEQWKKAREAIDKGLPQTAITALEPIIAQSMKEKAHAEAIQAIALRVALESSIEGDKPEERITRLQAEIDRCPAEMKPAMQAILAHCYWQYFQQNRWRFLQRTQVSTSSGPDLKTWDLPRILTEIDAHFTAALADEKALKATPVSAFDGLLVAGSVPDTYRPTMFDFLAHEALQFYAAGEQGAVAAEDAFELDAGSPIFAPADEFLAWRLDTPDAGSPAPKAIRLYQRLLAFHADDVDQTAFADADLERLRFGHNIAVGEDKDERYAAALQRFVDRRASHEISARALAEWAAVLQAEGKNKEARELALRGWREFPKSAGGAMCFNIVQRIESKSASIWTERVWNEPLPGIQVTYRNVTKVFFRALPADFEAQLRLRRWSPYDLDEKQRHELLSRIPALEWSADLPPTADFRERTEEIPAPKHLNRGFYFILASHDRSFGEQDNQISFAPVWVSDLALVVRQNDVEGTIEGFVLQALTGEPLAGAKVESWALGSRGLLGPHAVVAMTDARGMFRILPHDNAVMLLARYGSDRLAGAGECWASRGHDEAEGDRTVFFTDRSLYRPGQTIHYKGIRFHFDQGTNAYRTLGGARVDITLRDPNDREIGRATHRCNDYGSFSGEFTAPRTGLTGRMLIRGPDGMTWFNVEEYKRPKFQVELAAPQEAPRLGFDTVVPGKVTAYTGMAIGGAKVRWRVVREVRFPPWCWWGRRSMRGGSQAIAHGTAVTESDGSFAIRFVARPDRSVPEKDEPTFAFHVWADVTDATGETRSSERLVSAGYTALQASLDAGEWQTPHEPVALTVQTRSLDGEPRPARGTVQLYQLEQPAKVARAGLAPGRSWGRFGQEGDREPALDPADPNTWKLGGLVREVPFATDETGATKLSIRLPAGIYRALLETTDRFGRAVHARVQIQVVDPRAKRFAIRIPNDLAAPQWQLQPGEMFVALWGTGYDAGRAYVEIEHRGKRLRGYWTAPGRTQEAIELPVTEDLRGGFILRVTSVRENRAYLEERIIAVPWSNKNLTVKWGSFRSKLEPGKEETWTATVTGPDSEAALAEMVAVLYDASLDQLQPHNWMRSFDVFGAEMGHVRASFANSALGFDYILGMWTAASMPVDLRYRAFTPKVAEGLWGFGLVQLRGETFAVATNAGAAARRPGSMEINLPPHMPAVAMPASLGQLSEVALESAVISVSDREAKPAADLGNVVARRNLQETAFFFPHLLSDAHGEVRMEFTMPEALTEWRFLGFAHDRELRSGFLGGRAITAKDLMVEPNPPRFVREGDAIEFTVKVSNQTTERQTGRVRLTLAEARTLRPMDAALGNAKPDLDFDVAAKQSRSYSWRLAVPDGCEFLTYKAVGATAQRSDGEEGYLPVLSRRILVTESLPLPVRGKQTRTFEFAKLLESGRSSTLRHQSLTVQMVSQPAWYAVMALPYLLEFPHECSEQVFDRLYANSLARHIADSDPKIRRIFDLWRDTPALDSPLEKNQELKAVLLEETPWLRQAQAESQARRSVGLLFDAGRLEAEKMQTLRRLMEMQTFDGFWPWFPGGRPDPYITLYITTGFGRLRHLGVDIDAGLAARSLNGLDAWMDDRYHDILRRGRESENHLDHTIAFYLYGRSFFLKDRPVAQEHRPALDYWLDQARRYWLHLDCRQSQAHVALALQRFGDAETPRAILKSLAERSVHSPELGMFWRDLEASWWWYRAPIETQAMMIEAFAEVANDSAAVEDCRVWLLKQKQTQDWKTTKATADAVYALLLRGDSLLRSDALVEVALGGERIEPEAVEAGTGFYEQRFGRGEIRPEMGRIDVTKRDAGVSWGSVHWQYLQDMAEVTPHEGTPLKLKKSLFTKETTRKGPALYPVTGPLAVGDEVVVRIELRTDRDMEYVHLADQRGSGTEPVDVLSQYKFQDGLAYYQSTRDTATHFFIAYLPKGVYVLEYSTRIQHRGSYQTGVATVQSMYAPEFNSHSQSLMLDVR